MTADIGLAASTPGHRLRLDPDGATEVVDTGGGSSAEVSQRVAFWAFVAYLGVAWYLLVFHFGGERWFYRDDWYFLSGRDGGDLHDLFEPHGEHLSFLPIVVYRLMFNVFGLRFTPYLALVVTMHLGVAALLRVVMRRAGVGPWVATAAAGALVLFGPGEENIQWAFQIGFVGSVLYGLTQLLLADHDGPIARRDWLGLLAGAAAVLSSGIGPLMVVGVGLATLVRRGWRAALFHTAPLGVLYGIWYLVVEPRDNPLGEPPFDVVFRWVREGMSGAFDALGHGSVVAAGLAAMLLVGGALLVASTPWRTLRRDYAATAALLLCGPLFFAITSRGRWLFGEEFARSSRYLYIAAVLLLPALAAAGDAIARRWAPLTVPVVVLLLVGVPGNVDTFGSSIFGPPYFHTTRHSILGLAQDPELDQIPDWVRPEPNIFNGPDLTVGWLRDARDAGRIPRLDTVDPVVADQFPVKLGLAHTAPRLLGVECRDETGAVDLDLVEGERLRIDSPVGVAARAEDGSVSLPVRFDPNDGSGTLEVVVPTLAVQLTPTAGTSSFTLCRPETAGA